MTQLSERIAQLVVGEPDVIFNLSVFPLFGSSGRSGEYGILGEAIDKGDARIKEVSEGGHVPQLLFENLGKDPILLVDGEQLIGCKQNRVLNMSILAPGLKETEIPVSCVERGRWRHNSDRFYASDESSFSEMRMAKMASVTENLERFDSAESDQGEVWRSISAKSSRLGSSSQSEAMSGIYERQRDRVDQYMRSIHAKDDQVGAVFAINGEIVGCEFFDDFKTFAYYQRKVTSGYVLDAIDRFDEFSSQLRLDDVEKSLADLRELPTFIHSGIGLGENIRLKDSEFVGAALSYCGRVLHFCALRSKFDSKKRDLSLMWHSDN
jgi:hypothetical protein